MGFAEVVATLRLEAEQFYAGIGKAEASVTSLSRSGASNFEKLASAGKTALLGIGAVAVGVGVAAVDFGDKLEASQASLQASLKAAGISWDSVKGSVSATGAAATKYGFTQAQIDAALSQGVISTQNYGSAHKNLGVAIQLAAAKHIDLSSAMQMVDKAAIGQTRALKQMGIDLPVVQSNALKVKQAQDALSAANLGALGILRQFPDAIDAGSKHHAAYEAAVLKVAAAHHKLAEEQGAGGQILDALSKRLSGQASAAADTFQGRINAVKAQGENLAANLGMRLIPVLEKLLGVITRVVTWLETHRSVAIALGIALGTVTAGLIAMSIAGAIAEATFSPVIVIVGAVVAALVLLGIGIYELVTHWKEVWTDIKNWVNDAWQYIKPIWDLLYAYIVGPMVSGVQFWIGVFKQAFTDSQTAVTVAWSIIKGAWDLLYAYVIGPMVSGIQFWVGIFEQAWTDAQTAVSTAWNFISGTLTTLTGWFTGLPGQIVTAIGSGLTVLYQWGKDLVTGIVNGIGDAASAIGTALWNAIKGAVTSAKGAINSIPIVGSAVSTITGGLLAGGGPAQANTPYIVGENGPELFIPSASGVVVPNGSFGPGTGAGPSVGGTGGGSGGNVQVVLQIDGQQIAQALFPGPLFTQMLQNKRSLVSLGLS